MIRSLHFSSKGDLIRNEAPAPDLTPAQSKILFGEAASYQLSALSSGSETPLIPALKKKPTYIE